MTVTLSKRFGALLMALVMIFSMFPTTAFAEETAPAEPTTSIEEIQPAPEPAPDPAPQPVAQEPAVTPPDPQPAAETVTQTPPEIQPAAQTVPETPSETLPAADNGTTEEQSSTADPKEVQVKAALGVTPETVTESGAGDNQNNQAKASGEETNTSGTDNASGKDDNENKDADNNNDQNEQVTISFVVNGTEDVNLKQTVKKDSVVTLPSAPTVEGKTFVGWFLGADGSDKVEGTVTADSSKTVYGIYETTKYTITWMLDENTLIDATQVELNATPAHADAVKEPTIDKVYTFTAWTPEIVAATEDATYTANFTEATRTYTVTFVDDNGDVLKEAASYDYGTAAGSIAKPDDPTKAEDQGYTYTFAGWSPEISDVAADVTYTATYTATPKTYAVTFVDEDGETILKEAATYNYGTPAAEIAQPDAPTKAATAEYTYTFSGWDPTLADVSGNVTYKAVYTAEKNKYTVSFVTRDAEEVETRTIEYGTAIGALPGVPDYDDHTGVWVYGTSDGRTFTPGSTPATADDIVTGNVVIGPKYTQIEYTVTFYNEDKSAVLKTVKVNSGSNYSVDDMPTPPEKDGYIASWAYSGGVFDNTVVISEDTAVWASYKKNVFTVTFMLDESEVYFTDTFYDGDELALPANPTAEGKQFVKWLYEDGETEAKAGDPVTSDLTITADFDNMYEVTFVVSKEDAGGEEDVRLSQYFAKEGATVGTLPQAPFIQGKVFEKWINADTSEEVTAETPVNGNITAVAVFHEVAIYEITVEYFYKYGGGSEHVFDTELIDVEAGELPYTITVPASTKTDAQYVPGSPVYYASQQTVEVKQSDFNAQKKATVRVEFVSHTAEYDFVYLLKNLPGEEGSSEFPGYTVIESEHVLGVLDSVVTPTVKTYDYANLESAPTVVITQKSGQKIPVYYTRKNFSLSFETNGGSYVPGGTYAYGTEVTLPTGKDAPKREGYDFTGWYTEADETGDGTGTQVTGTVEILGDTTLYAGWEGKEVTYTVIYMKEQYNEAGTATSYVYEDSRTVRGKVGTTVTASNPPSTTFNPGTKIPYHVVDTDKNASGEDSTKVTIEADGSTVLMVYYKLKEYTFTFHAGTFSTRYGTYDVTATLTDKGVSGSGLLNYSFKAKLGQNISSLWPSSGTGTYYYDYYDVTLAGWSKPDAGSEYQDLKQYRLTTQLLPSSGTSILYTAVWTDGDTTYKVNIYLQNADDDGYTLSTIYSQEFVTDGWQPGGWGRPGYWPTTYLHDPINGYIYNESKSTPDGTWESDNNHRNPRMNIYYEIPDRV